MGWSVMPLSEPERQEPVSADFGMYDLPGYAEVGIFSAAGHNGDCACVPDRKLDWTFQHQVEPLVVPEQSLVSDAVTVAVLNPALFSFLNVN
jgi:hypothetical protein